MVKASSFTCSVSSVGRGAYVLYDVTSYFPQAPQLWFGRANNDSAPDASYLTDGTVGSRPLIRYGSGLLTIAGDATYSGGTTIEGGAVMLGTGGATSKSWSERERVAYNAVFTKSPLRHVYDPHWSVWAAGFGGSQTTDGNAATGSNSATSRIFGVAAGADYLLSPRTVAGFGLAGVGTNFSVANAGTGRSDLFQAGAYVRHTVGNIYVSAALAYG